MPDTIDIKIAVGGKGLDQGGASRTVHGVRVGNGLAVTRSTRENKLWVITHLPTGTCLPGGFLTREEALTAARKIKNLAPWERLRSDSSKDWVDAQPESYKAICKTIDEYSIKL